MIEPEYIKEEKRYNYENQVEYTIKVSKEYTDSFYGLRRNKFMCWISRDYDYKNHREFRGWFVRAMVASIDDTYWIGDFSCKTFEEAKEKFKIARRFLSVLPRKGVSLEYFKKYFIEENGFTFDW